MSSIVIRCSSEANIISITEQIEVIEMIEYEQNLIYFAMDSFFKKKK